jgi:hypothetical protein
MMKKKEMRKPAKRKVEKMSKRNRRKEGNEERLDSLGDVGGPWKEESAEEIGLAEMIEMEVNEEGLREIPEEEAVAIDTRMRMEILIVMEVMKKKREADLLLLLEVAAIETGSAVKNEATEVDSGVVQEVVEEAKTGSAVKIEEIEVASEVIREVAVVMIGSVVTMEEKEADSEVNREVVVEVVVDLVVKMEEKEADSEVNLEAVAVRIDSEEEAEKIAEKEEGLEEGLVEIQEEVQEAVVAVKVKMALGSTSREGTKDPRKLIFQGSLSRRTKDLIRTGVPTTLNSLTSRKAIKDQ